MFSFLSSSSSSSSFLFFFFTGIIISLCAFFHSFFNGRNKGYLRSTFNWRHFLTKSGTNCSDHAPLFASSYRYFKEEQPTLFSHRNTPMKTKQLLAYNGVCRSYFFLSLCFFLFICLSLFLILFLSPFISLYLSRFLYCPSLSLLPSLFLSLIMILQNFPSAVVILLIVAKRFWKCAIGFLREN